ncbi:MAG: hypothetical protein M3N29_09845 [Chloroflexota bacterium]|nr:hypothetical protein [Chloroflexota bacterium]
MAVIDAAVTDTRRAKAGEIGQRLGMTRDEVLESPQVLIGTVAQIGEQLEQLRADFGFSYIAVAERGWQALPPVVEHLSGR